MAVDKAKHKAFFRVLDLNLRFEYENVQDAPEGKFLGRDEYVAGLHEQQGTDPVESLRSFIELNASSGAYLFSGMRGSGKTTELRRLQYELLQTGDFFPIYIDAKDHYNLLEELQVGDFLLTLSAAIAEFVARDSALGRDFIGGGYWDRFVDTLKSDIESDGLTLEAGWKNLVPGVDAKIAGKLKLKDNPSFKKEVQAKLRLKNEALEQGAARFFADVARYIKARTGKSRVLLLVDSLEHLRGVTEDDSNRVFESVAALFSLHHSALRLPEIDVVYSIPPYLAAISQGFAAYYSGGRVFPLANVHVFNRQLDEVMESTTGIARMREVISRRFAEWSIFFDEAALNRLIVSSGGDLRDLFRLIQNCLTSARPEKMDIPFPEAVLSYAEGVLREDFRFLSNENMAWLARVAQSKWHEMRSRKELAQLAMLLDGKSMLNYRNGEDWYDVHPLLKARALSFAKTEHGNAGA